MRSHGGSDPARRRGPLVGAGIVTGLVLTGAVFSRSPLRDAATLEPFPGAHLTHPLSYLLAAPIHGVIDAISLLTLRQHYAWVATALLLYAVWRLLRRRRRRTLAARIGVETGAAALCLGIVASIYVVGMYVPRPMARLVLDDPEAMAVDFHSHTDHSHDGVDGFTVDRNRSWHAAAGYDAVFISDHRTWGAMIGAREGNPDRAGDGVVLLPAMETRYRGPNVVALGTARRYRGTLDEDRNLDPGILDASAAAGDRPASLILTLPADLDDLRAAGPGSPAGLVALEVNDASPKGLEQSRSRRRELLRIADSLDLAVVAGSNTHGLGSTAAAWTVLRIEGWRGLTPEALGRRIEEKLRTERGGAAAVVERWIPYPGESPAALALTLPLAGWHLFASLSLAERLAWLAWAWGLGLGLGLRAGRRRSRENAPAGVR